MSHVLGCSPDDDDVAAPGGGRQLLLHEIGQLRRELAAAQDTIANLENALSSNRMIGAAVGIVMSHRHVDMDAAFELIRSASQRRNVKVRDIAAEVTYTGFLDETGGRPPAQGVR